MRQPGIYFVKIKEWFIYCPVWSAVEWDGERWLTENEVLSVGRMIE